MSLCAPRMCQNRIVILWLCAQRLREADAALRQAEAGARAKADAAGHQERRVRDMEQDCRHLRNAQGAGLFSCLLSKRMAHTNSLYIVICTPCATSPACLYSTMWRASIGGHGGRGLCLLLLSSPLQANYRGGALSQHAHMLWWALRSRQHHVPAQPLRACPLLQAQATPS